MVIWNNRLLHGNGRNVSDRPRLAQYITMWPAERASEAQLADRVTRWERRLPPDAEWAPGDPRRTEELFGTTATLTPLGERLLGKTRWE
jgi:ectoine hydroxylase-related dioxygenase (phytanoyl-CoA dioxygenase family)